MRICLEQSAFPGVIRVTEKVAHDVELVSGKKPQILVEKEIPETLESSGEDWTIIAATKGKSSFLKKLEEAGSAELKELEQKRECYAWIFPEIKNRTKSNLLVIAGRQKRNDLWPFSFIGNAGSLTVCRLVRTDAAKAGKDRTEGRHGLYQQRAIRQIPGIFY